MRHLKAVGFQPRLAFSMADLAFSVGNVSCGKISRPIPAHSHGHGCYEIHYIPAGSGTVILNGRARTVSSGCLWTAGPLCEHTQIPLPSDPMWEYCLYLSCRPTHALPADPFFSRFIETAAFLGQDLFCMEPLFLLLLEELSGRAPGARPMAEALLRQLIVCTARNYAAVRREPAGETPGQDSSGPGGILDMGTGPNASAFCKIRREAPVSVPEGESLRIEQYFLGSCKEFSLKTLAGLLGLGPRQTQRLLRTLYGKTFQQKALEARMEQAALLLTQTPSKIGEIADRMGYSSAEHFSAAFRKYYGMTPRDFRKNKDGAALRSADEPEICKHGPCSTGQQGN